MKKLSLAVLNGMFLTAVLYINYCAYQDTKHYFVRFSNWVRNTGKRAGNAVSSGCGRVIHIFDRRESA